MSEENVPVTEIFPTRLRPRVQKHFPGQSLTVQADKDSCDVNQILARYQKTGAIEHMRQYQGDYADVSGAVDYKTALDITIRAQDMFAALPSTVRARFENDPGKFLEAVEDPDQRDELVELGILPASKPAVVPSEAVAELAEALRGASGDPVSGVGEADEEASEGA